MRIGKKKKKYESIYSYEYEERKEKKFSMKVDLCVCAFIMMHWAHLPVSCMYTYHHLPSYEISWSDSKERRIYMAISYLYGNHKFVYSHE